MYARSVLGTWNISVNQGKNSFLHKVCILVRESQIVNDEHNELINYNILRGYKWYKKVKQGKGSGGMGVGKLLY